MTLNFSKKQAKLKKSFDNQVNKLKTEIEENPIQLRNSTIGGGMPVSLQIGGDPNKNIQRFTTEEREHPSFKNLGVHEIVRGPSYYRIKYDPILVNRPAYSIPAEKRMQKSESA